MANAIIRVWNNELIMLFPDELATIGKLLVGSYMTVGQHGAANYNMIVSQSKLADYQSSEVKQFVADYEKQYNDKLRLVKRQSCKMYQELLNQYYGSV